METLLYFHLQWYRHFLLLLNYPRFESHEDTVIVAAVQSEYMLSPATFNSISSVDGIGILNSSLNVLIYLRAVNIPIKTKILRFITSVINTSITCSIPINDVDFDSTVNFYVQNGFILPRYDDNRQSVILKWRKPISKSDTLNTITKIKSAVKNERCWLTIIITQEVAIVFEKIIKFMNEVAGILFINSYNADGEAILGINSDYILEGTIDRSNFDLKLSPFSFHSHPEHITSEYDAFISWPSGQDMRIIIADENDVVNLN